MEQEENGFNTYRVLEICLQDCALFTPNVSSVTSVHSFHENCVLSMQISFLKYILLTKTYHKIQGHDISQAHLTLCTMPGFLRPSPQSAASVPISVPPPPPPLAAYPPSPAYHPSVVPHWLADAAIRSESFCPGAAPALPQAVQQRREELMSYFRTIRTED